MSDCQRNTPNRGLKAGDVQTKGQQPDEQTREALIDKLVDCLYSFEGDTDTSAIDRCLEELEEAGEVSEDFDVEQGLKDFRERFDSMFRSSSQVVKKKTSRNRRLLARIAIIAAILFALVFTIQAAGYDIFGAIARWTSEQFSFVRVAEEEREDDRQLVYASLQAALDDCKIIEKLSPTKFPEGSEITDILIREEKNGVLISATYVLGNEKFYISIRGAVGVPHMEIEINDPSVETYEAGEINHYIMTDVKQEKVMWYNGEWECYIAGELSRDELRLMIDSIYE